jgi:hypothetical protein
MKRLAQLVSALALAGAIVPACLFFADRLSLPASQQCMLAAAVAWFLATPFWMEHKTGE